MCVHCAGAKTHAHVRTHTRTHTPHTCTQVALKCPKPGVPKRLETDFVRELMDTLRVSRTCPHVIQCFGHSAMRSGAACIVMELYATSLHKLLSDACK